MVDERTAYWGDRDAARYRTRDDDPTGGDYVVAETLDANGDPVEVLLRWDDTAGEWVSGGPVNMSGEDVTNVGALDADSVSTDEASIDGDQALRMGSRSDVTESVSFGTWRTPNADLGTFLSVEVFVESDGIEDATVNLEIDYSGGESADRDPQITKAALEGGDGNNDQTLTTVILPAGASYRLVNRSDPNSNNTISSVDERTI